MINSKKIMAKSLTIVCGVAIFFAVQSASPTRADEDTPDFSKFEKLKNYEATGNKKTCVRLRNIRSTTILDDATIFFKMRGKKSYVNKMPRKCAGLKRHNAFSYKTSTSQLCRVDLITILDTSMMMDWGSCGLGNFYEIVEKEKKDPSKDQTTGK